MKEFVPTLKKKLRKWLFVKFVIIEKAYKYRLYLNKQQKIQMAKTFGCTCFIYKHYLDIQMKAYETDKTTCNYYNCAHHLKQLKSKYNWLKKIDSAVL